MKTRSTEKELIDLGMYTTEEYEACLKKLYLVGKYLGIHRDTFHVIQKLKPQSILDVGCGDGALLATVAKRYPDIRCHGIDISADAIKYAKQHKAKNLSFDMTRVLPKADCIMANLVMHHMTDSEIEEFLQKAYNQAKYAVLINDLQRSKVSKMLFKQISGPLFSNRLISHDGLISIERGFTKDELRSFCKNVCHTISWCFPFRWQVILWKK